MPKAIGSTFVFSTEETVWETSKIGKSKEEMLTFSRWFVGTAVSMYAQSMSLLVEGRE